MTENEIQKAVFKHIRQRGMPGVFAFHPKNGGIHQRGRRRGINAGLGVVSGVPDIIIISRSHTYALELKTEKGKLDQAQIDTHNALTVAGATVATAHGLDAAIAQLEGWGILRGRAAA